MKIPIKENTHITWEKEKITTNATNKDIEKTKKKMYN